jgi:uncharacterized protein (TIGR02466 family)
MIRNLFSVPIYVSNVEIKEQMLIEQTIVDADFVFFKGSNFGLESDVQMTDLYDNFFQNNKFNFFESVVQKHLKIYLDNVQNEILEFEIDAAWVTKSFKGDVITAHNHRGADISCVYYVKTNNKDGDLALYNPNSALDATSWINQNNIIKINPNPGQIVFFPSWLLHSTTINKTDNERISVAIDFVEK